MRRFFEGVILLASLLLAAKWTLDPSGPYEPFIAFIGAAWASLDFFFGNKREPHALPSPIGEKQTSLIQHVPANKPKKAEVELPNYTWTSTSDFFSERFSSAFPGIRATTWFHGQEAVERLAILLKAPLTFKNRDFGQTSPIWWFGRGNLQIEAFKQIDAITVLINFDEYKVSRIAAVFSTNYRRLWVYVETDPMQPTGLYPKTQNLLARAAANGETYAEEYAIFDSTRKVTRSEYDDGHANIGGKIVEISGRSELRVRHLTPYNFIICSHDSPINNMQFDQCLEEFLNHALKDPNLFPKFESTVAKLPINRNP